MKRNSRMNKVILSAAVFSLAMAGSAFAQDYTAAPSASQSMRQAGQEVKNAGSDTVSAAKDAGNGTVTAVRDTTITAKVKMALHKDKAIEDSDIHVDTVAGVVTLTGDVPSSDTAAQAERVTDQTGGVKGINNQLKVSQAANIE